MTDIAVATARYEGWLARHAEVVAKDIEAKHSAMSASPFGFFRATFYRWAQRFPLLCPDLNRAPRLTALGDLHTDNYGTWRDAEGRMVWGVNDFDEAHEMPYTIDLVRLATSAGLAHEDGRLSVGLARACRAILDGYAGSIAAHGHPLVLADGEPWLRRLAENRARDPHRFWDSMRALPTASPGIYNDAIEVARGSLPHPHFEVLLVRRRSGIGSLGRKRLVAIARHRGGLVAREAKALVPSAWEWAYPEDATGTIHYQALASAAVRAHDPKMRVVGSWLVRRLAPDCRRVEFTNLFRRGHEVRMLQAMGWEAANVHLANRSRGSAVQADLAGRPASWLAEAADLMQADVLSDYRRWRHSAAKRVAVRVKAA